MKTKVFCTTSFQHWHRWKDAPHHVRYLRDLHRHIFHVRLEKTVLHDDREIEFITMKDLIDEKIREKSNDKETLEWSCEHWASFLLRHFDADLVEVSEDGENGATVQKD